MKEADAVWREIDAASQEKDAEKRQYLFDDLANRLKILADELGDAETQYALGYVLYKNPRRMTSPALQDAVEVALKAVLAGDPNHAFAKVYLGYNAYDVGRYDVAKEYFDGADPAQLSLNFILSRQELLLCIAIRTAGLRACFFDLERYVVALEAAEVFDIFPMSLARTLEDIAGTLTFLTTDERTRLTDLAKRIDRAGQFRDWFQKLVGAESSDLEGSDR